MRKIVACLALCMGLVIGTLGVGMESASATPTPPLNTQVFSGDLDPSNLAACSVEFYHGNYMGVAYAKMRRLYTDECRVRYDHFSGILCVQSPCGNRYAIEVNYKVTGCLFWCNIYSSLAFMDDAATYNWVQADSPVGYTLVSTNIWQSTSLYATYCSTVVGGQLRSTIQGCASFGNGVLLFSGSGV